MYKVLLSPNALWLNLPPRVQVTRRKYCWAFKNLKRLYIRHFHEYTDGSGNNDDTTQQKVQLKPNIPFAWLRYKILSQETWQLDQNSGSETENQRAVTSLYFLFVIFVSHYTSHFRAQNDALKLRFGKNKISHCITINITDIMLFYYYTFLLHFRFCWLHLAKSSEAGVM